MAIAEMQSAQLLMAAGFIMLGWVLARRQLSLRKRVNHETRVANKALKSIRESKEPSIPLSDAPVETQRWQVAMFDLQRELKAELDTRIVIVQTLMRQLDQRIECLSQLDGGAVSIKVDSETDDVSPLEATILPMHHQTISDLARIGHTSSEIADKLGLPIGDIEMVLSTVQI